MGRKLRDLKGTKQIPCSLSQSGRGVELDRSSVKPFSIVEREREWPERERESLENADHFGHERERDTETEMEFPFSVKRIQGGKLNK